MQNLDSKNCAVCGVCLKEAELRPKVGSSKMVCDACLLKKEGQQMHQMRKKYGRPHQFKPMTKKGAPISVKKH